MNSNISETKTSRMKIRNNLKPSRVLFIRRLPYQCSESEISDVVDQSVYGNVKVVSVPLTRVGFIEFETVELAVKFLNERCNNSQLEVRDQVSEVAFSERKELLPPPEKDQTPLEPNYLIHITVEGAQYAITVRDMQERFEKYGKIKKIVTFTSPKKVQQALVQFEDVETATEALEKENGTPIYKNCVLKIDYSKLDDLTVKYNDRKTKDFNKDLPPRNATRSEGSPVIYISSLSPKTTCDELFTLLGVYGDVETVKILPLKSENALVQYTNTKGADNAVYYLRDSIPLHGRNITVSRSKHMYIAKPQQPYSGYKNYHNHPHHRFRKFKNNRSLKNIAFPSKVLHVSNLHGTVDEQELFQIFGQFAQVENIKFFGEKECEQDGEQIIKKMALVQLSSLSGAVRALIHCHSRTVNGLLIRVSFSFKQINPEVHPESPISAQPHPQLHQVNPMQPPSQVLQHMHPIPQLHQGINLVNHMPIQNHFPQPPYGGPYQQ